MEELPASAVDFPTNDNSFDFTDNTNNIHIAYDPTFDLSTFDSSAFDFSTTADNNAFAADPALQDYSTQDFSSQWCDSYAAFDTQQQQGLDSTTSSYPMTTADSQSQLLAYDTQQHSLDSTGSAAVSYPMTESQNVVGTFGGHHYEQHQGGYNGAEDQEGQAYGGAVKDGGGALGGLGDASSYLAAGGGGLMQQQQQQQHQGELLQT
jgi:hypothetical protein